MSFFTGPKALYGLYQAHQASKALKRLANERMPQYRSAESIYSQASQATPHGYTPEQTAQFQQQLARQGNNALRTAQDRNPNLAGVVTAGINYGNVSAINNFAAQDAQLRESKINRLAGAISAQSNNNTSEALRQRREKELAYGTAYQNAISNVFGALDQVDRDAASVTSIVTGGGFGGGNKSMGAPTAQPLGNRVPSTAAQNPPQDYFSSNYGSDLYGNPVDTPAYSPYYQNNIPYKYNTLQ